MIGQLVYVDSWHVGESALQSFIYFLLYYGRLCVYATSGREPPKKKNPVAFFFPLSQFFFPWAFFICGLFYLGQGGLKPRVHRFFVSLGLFLKKKKKKRKKKEKRRPFNRGVNLTNTIKFFS